MIVRVTNGYEKLNEGGFIKFLGTVATKMQGNEHFPNRQEAVKALQTQQEEYLKLVANASGGGKEAIMLRDAKRSMIIDLLHRLGADVTADSKGDPIIVATTGFPYTQEKKPLQILVKPAPPKVKPGVNSGELVVIGYKQTKNGAVMVLITDTPADSSAWKPTPGTRSKVLYTGLESGKRYYIKYVLTGANDQRVESDVLSYIPQ